MAREDIVAEMLARDVTDVGLANFVMCGAAVKHEAGTVGVIAHVWDDGGITILWNLPWDTQVEQLRARYYIGAGLPGARPSVVLV